MRVASYLLINVFHGTPYTNGEFQSKGTRDSVLCRLGQFLEKS